MNQENLENSFNSSTTFDKSMVEILSSLLENKFNDFLEYCLTTHNAQPLKAVIDISENNKF